MPCSRAPTDPGHILVPGRTAVYFHYRIGPSESRVPSFATRRVAISETYIRFEVYLTEGSQGYDVMGYSKEQPIGDILDQYERHLEFLRLHRETLSGAVPERPGPPDTRADED